MMWYTGLEYTVHSTQKSDKPTSIHESYIYIYIYIYISVEKDQHAELT